MKLSFSRADRFQNCPRSFDLQYNQKVPEGDPSEALLGGKYFHALAEAYGKMCAQVPKANRETVAIQVLNDSGRSSYQYDLAEDITVIFRDWVARTPMEFPDQSRYELMLAFNRKWEVVEWDADDAFLRMVMDRIDLLTVPTSIIDYKTNRGGFDAKKLQQLTYAFGANLALGDDKRDFQVAEQYVRFNKAMKFLTVTYDDYKHIGDYYLELSETIDANKDWEPTICGWCQFCAFNRDCPKYEEEIAGTDLDVTNLAQARALAEKVFTTDARSREAKKVLKAFTFQNGVVVFGDQEYGPKTLPEIVFDDLPGLNEAFSKNNLDLWDWLGLAKTNFEKAVKDKDLRAKLIEDHASVQDKVDVRFRKHKAK